MRPSDLIVAFKKRAPERWLQAYPRVFCAPKNYISASVPAAILLNEAMLFERDSELQNLTAYRIYADMVSHMMPTYYVGEDILDALLMTDAPELTVSEVHWPMPAAVFMLPLGRINHPVEGTVGFLSYCIQPGDSVSIVTCTKPETDPIVFQGSSPPDGSLRISALTQDRMGIPFSMDGEEVAPPPGVSDFLTLCISVVGRIVCLMSARPDMVESGTGQRKYSRGGQEYWTPNFIGRAYHLPTAIAPSDGGTQRRMHWRRGHMRRQPFGPGRLERKMIWIEPMLINA